MGATSQTGASLTDPVTIPRIRVQFGKALQLGGSLTNDAGQPLADMQLTVSREFRGGFPSEDLGSVTTDATGQFTYTLPAGPSALVRFQFAGTDVLAPSESDVRTLVKAAVTLKAKKLRVRRTAKIFRLTGVLLGTPLPVDGKTVRIQVRKGKTWRTVKTLRTNADGAYATKIKVKRRAHAKRLTVRTLVPRDRTYPYEKGTSTTRILRIPARR
jgi:hypothetical protein